MTVFDEIGNIAFELGCTVLKGAQMSEYTSFKIGGPANLFIKPDSAKKAGSLLEKCKLLAVPVLILGNGSNIVVSDKGFAGAVICTSEIDYCENTGDGIIECGAGVRLSNLCRFALEQSLSGLEFAYGIPGSAGGAAFMNAGAYGGEIKDILLACYHVSNSSVTGTYKDEDLDMSYRHSVYSGNGYMITGLKIQLKEADKSEINTKMNDVLTRRKDKQPLDLPSAGSVFKRPANYYAGELIELCGLKGFSVGGAMVSQKHAGFIVNTGRATSDDVYKLVEVIKETVFIKTSVSLETEILFIH